MASKSASKRSAPKQEYCHHTLLVKHEEFFCTDYKDHSGLHTVITLNPCPECVGFDKHDDACKYDGPEGNVMVRIEWTDEGTWSWEAS